MKAGGDTTHGDSRGCRHQIPVRVLWMLGGRVSAATWRCAKSLSVILSFRLPNSEIIFPSLTTPFSLILGQGRGNRRVGTMTAFSLNYWRTLLRPVH